MPQATILFVQTDSPEAAFGVLRDAIANVVMTNAMPRITHAEPLALAAPATDDRVMLQEVGAMAAAEEDADDAPPPKRRVKQKAAAAPPRKKPARGFKAPAGASCRERAIAYLRHLGRPEKRSAIMRACEISVGSSTAVFRNSAFQTTDAGLVWLADEAVPASADEDGCTVEAPPRAPPERPAPAQEADEPFVDDPPFVPPAANCALRAVEPPTRPVERRKPGPKPAASSIDDIVTTSGALDYAVGAIRAELAIADRPLSLNKLLALTKFPRHVVVAALENKGFEPADGGYVLAGPGGD